jgi:hypothetical protein
MRIVSHAGGRVLVAAVLALGVVATTGASAPAKSGVTKITFTVALTSTQRNLTMVGRGGTITYGFNQLDGTATSPSGDIGVQILGNVEYTNGSGPFFGFFTCKFASLSTLGLHMEGRATLRKDGTTALKAKLRVIGGNAAFTGATGTGSFTGERKAELGSPIEIKVTIDVRGISN